MPAWSFIAAGLMALPQASDATARRLLDTYPEGALRQARSGAANVRVFVDPQGQAYACEVLEVFGGESFGQDVCKPLQNGRFRAATAADGTRSYGMITFVARFLTPGRNRGEIEAVAIPPDITIVGGPGLSEPNFRIAAQVQVDGAIGSCEGVDGASEAMSVVACNQAKQSSWPIGRDERGSPVSYVAGLYVSVQLPPVG